MFKFGFEDPEISRRQSKMNEICSEHGARLHFSNPFEWVLVLLLKTLSGDPNKNNIMNKIKNT